MVFLSLDFLKDIVAAEVNKLKELGVEVMTNMVIGKVLSVEELLNEEGYDAVFIGTGAGASRAL